MEADEAERLSARRTLLAALEKVDESDVPQPTAASALAEASNPALRVLSHTAEVVARHFPPDRRPQVQVDVACQTDMTSGAAVVVDVVADVSEVAAMTASIMASTHGTGRRAQNQSIADIKAHVGPRYVGKASYVYLEINILYPVIESTLSSRGWIRMDAYGPGPTLCPAPSTGRHTTAMSLM